MYTSPLHPQSLPASMEDPSLLPEIFGPSGSTMDPSGSTAQEPHAVVPLLLAVVPLLAGLDGG